MKDSKGHGSNARGGGKHYLDPFDPRYPDSAARYASVKQDAQAAHALAAPGNPKSVAAPVHPDASGPRYNREAVNNAIASSNRAGRRIGGREAKMIHALLKGRH